MLNVEYTFFVSFGLRVERCGEQAWWLNFSWVWKGNGLLELSLFVERIPREIIFITLAISYKL